MPSHLTKNREKVGEMACFMLILAGSIKPIKYDNFSGLDNFENFDNIDNGQKPITILVGGMLFNLYGSIAFARTGV